MRYSPLNANWFDFFPVPLNIWSFMELFDLHFGSWTVLCNMKLCFSSFQWNLGCFCAHFKKFLFINKFAYTAFGKHILVYTEKQEEENCNTRGKKTKGWGYRNMMFKMNTTSSAEHKFIAINGCVLLSETVCLWIFVAGNSMQGVFFYSGPACGLPKGIWFANVRTWCLPRYAFDLIQQALLGSKCKTYLARMKLPYIG